MVQPAGERTMKEWLLDLVRCPVTHSPLQRADHALVEELNAAVTAGSLCNRVQQPVPTPLDGALVTADGTLAYGIFGEVPRLIADEAIPLDQLRDG